MLGVQIVVLCLSVAIAKPLFPLHQKWNWASTVNDNAEERSGNFEGDMILSSKQFLDLRLRTGLINLKYRWPNKVVPYQLSETFNEEQVQYIQQSLCMIEEVSCLRFVTKNSSHTDFVSVHADPSGCSSSVGYQGGEQRLNLAPNQPGLGCFRNGTIVHEFLHALGFFHMQSASDRDDYVTIVWDNIQPQHMRNFQKYNDSVITHFGVKYDYESVMHYPRTAFSIDDLDTIIPHDPLAEIGQRVRLSSGDIERLNKMYECEKRY